MDWKNEYKSHYAQADFGWKLTQQWKLEGAALFGKVDSNDIRHLGSDAPSGSELIPAYMPVQTIRLVLFTLEQLTICRNAIA